MARVMIRCPKTGKPVFTGMDFNERSFETATLLNNTAMCPHCRLPHTWNKEDAYLEKQTQ